MTKSPWSISDRQKRETSREQAFCSSGVPLRGCWAMAPVETEMDSSVSAKKNFRIVFLRSDKGDSVGASLSTPLRRAQPKRRVIICRWLVRFNARGLGWFRRLEALRIAAKFA